jgi:hypothetical protein
MAAVLILELPSENRKTAGRETGRRFFLAPASGAAKSRSRI